MNTTRPATENFLIRHATAIAIGTITLLMLLAGLSFWRQEEASTEARGWLVHTYEVIEHIESLMSELKDAETGQRGYLLTADEGYLEPYEAALREAPTPSPLGGVQQHPVLGSGPDTLGINSLKHDPILGPGVANASLKHRSIVQELAYIRTLTADNPVQQGNLDEMDGVAQNLLDYIAASIQAGQNPNGKGQDTKQLEHNRIFITAKS
jgi:hypothetical protein